jgi:hypothetical protein
MYFMVNFPTKPEWTDRWLDLVADFTTPRIISRPAEGTGWDARGGITVA